MVFAQETNNMVYRKEKKSNNEMFEIADNFSILFKILVHVMIVTVTADTKPCKQLKNLIFYLLANSLPWKSDFLHFSAPL